MMYVCSTWVEAILALSLSPRLRGGLGSGENLTLPRFLVPSSRQNLSSQPWAAGERRAGRKASTCAHLPALACSGDQGQRLFLLLPKISGNRSRQKSVVLVETWITMAGWTFT